MIVRDRRQGFLRYTIDHIRAFRLVTSGTRVERTRAERTAAMQIRSIDIGRSGRYRLPLRLSAANASIASCIGAPVSRV